MDHAAIIDALGGPAKVAAALRCHHAQPVRWRVSGIPPRRWKAVAELAAAAGLLNITVAVVAASAPERDAA